MEVRVAAMDKVQLPKFDEVKRLKNDYEQLIREVREELVGQIERAIAQLQEIGFHYTLEEDKGAGISGAKVNGRRLAVSGIQLRPAPSANFDGGKKCRVCGTVGHDGRAHRRQRGGRRPFTFDELAQLGLRPPTSAS